MICEIICVDGFLCMSHLDIVHILSAYVHIIHTLSGHMHIMCTLFAVVLDIFLPNRQCRCHPYVISTTLYISYHVLLFFAHCLHRCTLSMSFACCQHMYTSFACHLYHSSYTFIIHNLVFRTLSTHMHIVNVHLYTI